MFFVVGIVFAPIGGLLIWASTTVQELVIDYTHCANDAPVSPQTDLIPKNNVRASFASKDGSNSAGGKTVSTSRAFWWRHDNVSVTLSTGTKTKTTRCSLQFTLPDDFGQPVYLYYQLTNFYQNHRRYVKSLDPDQLQGSRVSNDSVKGGGCDPLTVGQDANGTKKPYYPCGLIADSVFNDTIHDPVLLGGNGNSNDTYLMTDKGITWENDKNLYKPTEYKWYEVVPPPNWQVKYPHGYTADTPPPNLQNDEAFQVWMRTAGLPTFNKLARKNDTAAMIKGTYRIDIDHCTRLSCCCVIFGDLQMRRARSLPHANNCCWLIVYPVADFHATKSIVLTTRTVMGGRNPVIGLAYVIVSGLCIVLGLLFLLAHFFKPRFVFLSLP